jgi:nitrate reductase (NAD(P)H)
MVKWLSKLEFLEDESHNHYHVRDNKVLPYPQVSLETDQSEWWEKPEFVLYEQVVNSVIVTPAHEEWLKISDGTATRGWRRMSGFCFLSIFFF